MSENTILHSLYALGYRGRMTGHGFRGLASTILNEVKPVFDEELIEVQLAHVDKNMVRGAYNHAKYLDQRIVMMQWLADYYDELRKGRFVKPLAYASKNRNDAQSFVKYSAQILHNVHSQKAEVDFPPT